MTEPRFPIDIAALASNLTERIRIVERLAGAALQSPAGVVSPLNLWKINKLAGKLAAQQIKDYYHRKAGLATWAVDDLRKLLKRFKEMEQAAPIMGEAAQSEFITPHGCWLLTYEKALVTMDLPSDQFSASRWRQPDIYYGEFAKACEPFLRFLHVALMPKCELGDETGTGFCVHSGVVADIQSHLLHRFELAMGWAIEADINVYCARRKLIKSQTTRQQYVAYFEDTFCDARLTTNSIAGFPCWPRWLSEVAQFLCAGGDSLIARLAMDREEIGTSLFGGKQIRAIKSFKLGSSDSHAGGASVVMVGLELEGSGEGTVVYKPRCVKSELAMQRLLAHLSCTNAVDFATYRVLHMEG